MKILTDNFFKIFLIVGTFILIELESFLIYVTEHNMSILDAHIRGVLCIGLVYLIGGILMFFVHRFIKNFVTVENIDVPDDPYNNCTNCMYFNNNLNVDHKKDNEISHTCTAFVKLGETIKYDCHKFEKK